MSTPNYPQSNLRNGQVDDPYGGQTANTADTAQAAFRDDQIVTLETQVVDDQWQGWRQVRLKVVSGGVAGDCLVNVLAGSDPRFTLNRVKDQAYSADTTPWFGLLREPVSASNVGRIILCGGGIPPSITGLAPGNPGELTFDTTTARLRIRAFGEPMVGWVNAQGYAQLLPYALG